MKITKKKPIIRGFLAGLLILPLALWVLPVSAIGEGQIEGGDIYRVRNETKGTGFSDPIGADACDTLQYKVRIHNPGPGVVENVNVSVDLPAGPSTTNVSSVTITADNAQPASTSDTATVNLSSSQSIAYLSGSTQLLDANGNVINSLPDGIVGGGVNIGEVGISIAELEFVQFKAKVNCPEKPPEQPEQPKQPPAVVTPTQPTPPAASAPATTTSVSSLPNTGPGDVAAVFFAVTTASSAAYFVVVRRLDMPGV